MPRDRETGKFKGFAFVDVSTDDEIPKAIEALNGIEIEGRKLRVNRYLAKDQIRSAKTGRYTTTGKIQIIAERAHQPNKYLLTMLFH